MTYNVFGGTLNLAQLLIIAFPQTSLLLHFIIRLLHFALLFYKVDHVLVSV